MRLMVDGKLYDVRFERQVVERLDQPSGHGIKTLCSLSKVLDPKGKGKENYVGLGSSSVSRSRRERRDNKELARRKAFGKLLCSMYDRAIRKEFWKSYFLNTELDGKRRKEVPIFAS